MAKLVKTIVNQKKELAGFIVEATDKELGGFSNEKIRKPIPLSLLMDRGFINNQVEITQQGIKELGKFKINDLPMSVLVNNDTVDVDNSISLVKRWVQGNNTIGFTVRFADGSEDNITYANVIRLSYWFKASNFVVRTSATGNKFIAGRPGGILIEDLPVEELPTNKPNKTNKNNKNNKNNKQTLDNLRTTGELENIVDIVSMYDALKRYDGLIIKLANDEYKSISNQQYKVGTDFVPIPGDIGEVAYPNLIFTETKLNVGVLFKKPGLVKVEFHPGRVEEISSFTYSNKLIFVNGENHMKRLGIAIPKSAEYEFVGQFGRSMSIKKINPQDTVYMRVVASLFGKREDLVFYELDTSKMSIIANDQLKNYLLNAKELKELVEKLYENKAILKYLSQNYGLIAELSQTYNGSIKELRGIKPVGMYGGLNEEYLNKIRDAGIDIYSGAYIRKEKIQESEPQDEQQDQEDTSLIIDYMIENKDIKKITYKSITSGSVQLPQSLILVMNKINNISNIKDKLITAYEILDKTEKEVSELKKKLWLHKASMVVQGNKLRVHTHDKNNWKLNEARTKRTKRSKIYNCTSNGCTGLMIAVTNIDI